LERRRLLVWTHCVFCQLAKEGTEREPRATRKEIFENTWQVLFLKSERRSFPHTCHEGI
jgi:hypothetical protein